MTNPVSNAVPFTAWEQAVFVALFLVMVIMLLRWFTSQQKNWQVFIRERDQQWQTFLEAQRQSDCDNHDELKTSVVDLAEVTGKLVERVNEIDHKFDVHIAKEEQAIETIVSKIGAGRKVV